MTPAREAQELRRQVTLAEKRMSQAKFIGWPALEESYRRELEALRAKLPKKDQERK